MTLIQISMVNTGNLDKFILMKYNVIFNNSYGVSSPLLVNSKRYNNLDSLKYILYNNNN